MSIKTKRIIALSICLLLLTAAIYQNIRSNSKGRKANNDDKSGIIVNDDNDNDDETGEILDAEEFFAGARLERDSKRSLAEAECIAVISDAEASEDEKEEAQQLQIALEMMIQLEEEMETSIKSRGYEDVFVELDEDGYINITVMAEELTETEVMVLANIVVDSTEAELDRITIKSII